MVVAVAVVFILAVVNPSEASDFDLSLYQGQQKLGTAEPNFNDLLDDGRPIVLNFWGGDCPPCRAEMPGFQRFYEEHEGELTLIGLDVGRFFGLGTEQSALRLLEELEITYPAGKPRDGSAVNGYNVRSLPATVFFDADGQVFRQWDGLISEDQLQDIVEAMLGSS